MLPLGITNRRTLSGSLPSASKCASASSYVRGIGSPESTRGSGVASSSTEASSDGADACWTDSSSAARRRPTSSELQADSSPPITTRTASPRVSWAQR